MGNWFSRLLGLQEGVLVNVKDWNLELAVPWLGVAFLAAFVTVAVLWIYRRESGGASRSIRGALVALRCLTILLVAVLLFKPILAVEKLEDRRPTVAFLVDDSLSMTIQGGEYPEAAKRLDVIRILTDRFDLADFSEEDEARLRASDRYGLARAVLASTSLAWIEELRKTHRVRLHLVGGGAPASEVAATGAVSLGLPEAPTARATRLGDALREVLQGSRGQYLAAVVLLTDGQSNAGEDPVAVARFAGHRKPDPVPFFCVGLGSDAPQRDVEVVSVQAPPDVLKSNQPFEVKTTIRSKGFAGRSVKVTLWKGETLVDDRNLSLTDGLGGQTVVFQQIPSETGAFPYTVRLVEIPEGDLIADNNSGSQTVRVTDRKFRVLYIEGLPRFEYHRLEALLDRNKDIYEYSVLLLSADLRWSQPARPEEKRLSGFPASYRDLLEGYDLIVFGDVDPRHPHLRAGYDEDVRKFVLEGGGAFVMVAGMFFAPQAYRGSPIESILPLSEISREPVPLTIRDPFPVQLNPLLDHPLMQLHEDPVQGTRMWHDQFRPHWHWHVEEVKPAARVLLQHATHRTRLGKPCPLMVLMQAGRGQSLFIGLDETWRWPRGIPEGNPKHPFNRFWNQAIKYLASDKLIRGGKSLMLKLDRAGYAIGEQAIVTLEVLDVAIPGFGTDAQVVEMQVMGPDRIARAHPLRREPGTANFVGTLPLSQKGHHELKVLAREGGGGGEPLAQAAFDVREFTAEFATPQMNRAVLSEMAKESGGQFVELSELGGVPELLKSRTRQVTRRIENPLMDAPLVFWVFCLAIVAEWIVRKRSRMM